MNLSNGNSKLRYTAPPPETIDLYKRYTFSINPDTRNQRSFLKQYEQLTSCINKFSHIDGLEYLFVVELSSSGKVHCHGIVYFNKMLAIGLFYETLFVLKDLCAYEMDTIEDYDKWRDYVKKGINYMKYLAKRYGVKYIIKTAEYIKFKDDSVES